MIKITAGDVFPAIQAVGELMEQKTSPRIALTLAALARALEPLAKDVAEQEAEILLQAGATQNEMGQFAPKVDPNGVAIPGSVRLEDEEAAASKLQELRTTTQVVAAQPIMVGWLEDAGVELTGRMAYSLGVLLGDE